MSCNLCRQSLDGFPAISIDDDCIADDVISIMGVKQTSEIRRCPWCLEYWRITRTFMMGAETESRETIRFEGGEHV